MVVVREEKQKNKTVKERSGEELSEEISKLSTSNWTRKRCTFLLLVDTPVFSPTRQKRQRRPVSTRTTFDYSFNRPTILEFTNYLGKVRSVHLFPMSSFLSNHHC